MNQAPLRTRTVNWLVDVILSSGIKMRAGTILLSCLCRMEDRRFFQLSEIILTCLWMFSYPEEGEQVIQKLDSVLKEISEMKGEGNEAVLQELAIPLLEDGLDAFLNGIVPAEGLVTKHQMRETLEGLPVFDRIMIFLLLKSSLSLSHRSAREVEKDSDTINPPSPAVIAGLLSEISGESDGPQKDVPTLIEEGMGLLTASKL